MGGALITSPPPPFTPQVYIQGLLVTDASGGILHRRQLDAGLVAEAVAFARAQQLSLTAYLGDRIVCEARDSHTDRLIFYKEPTPEAIGGFLGVGGGGSY